MRHLGLRAKRFFTHSLFFNTWYINNCLTYLDTEYPFFLDSFFIASHNTGGILIFKVSEFISLQFVLHYLALYYFKKGWRPPQTLADSLQVLMTHLPALEVGVSSPDLHLKDDAKIRNELISEVCWGQLLTSLNIRMLIPR